MSNFWFRTQPLFLFVSIMVALLATGLSGQQHSKLDLIAEVQSVAENSTFNVAISLDPHPGWHVYWKNPGDNGTSPSVTWTLPEGFEAGELQFTTPSFVPFMDFMSYGYDQKALFVSAISTPSEFDGPVRVSGSVRWLVCDDSICVPESGKVSLSIAKGSGDNPSSWQVEFERARAKQPKKVGWKAEYVATEESVILEVLLPEEVEDVADVWFFPAAKKLINHAKPQSISVNESVIRITCVPGIRFDRYQEIAGVLRTIPSSTNEKSHSYEINARRVKQLPEREVGEPNTRSPLGISALSASH